MQPVRAQAIRNHWLAENGPRELELLFRAIIYHPSAPILVTDGEGTSQELSVGARRLFGVPREQIVGRRLEDLAVESGKEEVRRLWAGLKGVGHQKGGPRRFAATGGVYFGRAGQDALQEQFLVILLATSEKLRALQEKSFERLGVTKTIPINVRLIAATNRHLGEMMGDKLFRSDLYYRLNVFPIASPALRDRTEDIPLLVRHFTAKYAEKMNRSIDTIPIETMRTLLSWPWPGNIRELENFIERSVILSPGPTLQVPFDEIKPEALPQAGTATLEQVERDHITRVIRECNGVVTAAATRLGLHRTTLNAMMRKLGVSRKDL